MISNVICICVFLIASDIKCLFMCLFAICLTSVEMFAGVFGLFSNRIICVLLFSFKSFYILRY